MQFKVLEVLYFYKSQKLEASKKEYITHVWYVVDSKWDSFEIDKSVVLSSRGEELMNPTFYDKWNIQKIMFALKLRLMNHSQSKYVGFWDTYVKTLSERNVKFISNQKNISKGRISIIEKVPTSSYRLYYTKITVMEINI